MRSTVSTAACQTGRQLCRRPLRCIFAVVAPEGNRAALLPAVSDAYPAAGCGTQIGRPNELAAGEIREMMGKV